MIEAAATQAATRSPFQTARPGRAETVDREAVGQHVRGCDLQPQQRHPQGHHVGDVHAERVALLRFDADHRPGDRLAGDLVVQPLPLQRGQQLGVPQALDLPGLRVAEDRRRRRPAARRRRRDRPRRHRRPGRARRAAAPARSRRARSSRLTSTAEVAPTDISSSPRPGLITASSGAGWAGAGTSAKVAGRCSRVARSKGATIAKAGPTTFDRHERDLALALAVREVREVAARVGAQAAVVAHHEDPVLGHHDLEPHVGRVDLPVGLAVRGTTSRPAPCR